MSDASSSDDRAARATRAAARLRGLVVPDHTAVLTMEVQRGVVGDQAMLGALVDQVREAGTVAAIARVCEAARGAGARVVHCTAEARPDGAGLTENCRLFAMNARVKAETGHYPIEQGTPGAELVPELGPEPADIVVGRIHGMSPWMSTSLDQILRNLGVRTVVATGVSVNVGILGLVLNAVDLGYQVVLVRDAVAGVPADYADAVIANSLAMLATVVTTDDLLTAWM